MNHSNEKFQVAVARSLLAEVAGIRATLEVYFETEISERAEEAGEDGKEAVAAFRKACEKHAEGIYRELLSAIGMSENRN